MSRTRRRKVKEEKTRSFKEDWLNNGNNEVQMKTECSDENIVHEAKADFSNNIGSDTIINYGTNNFIQPDIHLSRCHSVCKTKNKNEINILNFNTTTSKNLSIFPDQIEERKMYCMDGMKHLTETQLNMKLQLQHRKYERDEVSTSDLREATDNMFQRLLLFDSFRCLHEIEKTICYLRKVINGIQHLWHGDEDFQSLRNEPVHDFLDITKSLWKSRKKHEVECVSDVEDSTLGVDPSRVLQMILKTASVKKMPLHRLLYLFLEILAVLERNNFFEYYEF